MWLYILAWMIVGFCKMLTWTVLDAMACLIINNDLAKGPGFLSTELHPHIQR